MAPDLPPAADDDDDSDPVVDEMAAAIIDGAEIRWDDYQSRADPALVAQLRVLGAIVTVHGTPTGERLAPARAPTTVLSQWGPLTLLERIGAGAFGEVFRAWDRRLDREVALKLLGAAVVKPGEDPAASIGEGRLLAKVRHPNVVTVFGAECIDGRVGIWTEFIHGRTLAELESDQGLFGPDETTSIGVDLCRALAAIHGAGLLHRDIKPQNVMREQGGRIVLVDFGTGKERLAREFAESRDLSGTPLYLAPELWNGSAATPQSDIYSIGILLYYMMTGTYPVAGRTLQEVREAHHAGRRRLLRDARSGLPDAFIEVVERAIASDPKDRFESAGSFEAALRRAQFQHDIGPTGPAGTALGWTSPGGKTAPDVVGNVGDPRSWRRWLPVAGGLVGGAALALVIMTLPSREDNSVITFGRMTAITRDTGLEIHPSLSPDGSLIAYAAGPTGHMHIYVRQVVGGHPIDLTGSLAGSYGCPRWSIDGTRIAFVPDAGDGMSPIYEVPALGGVPRPLVDPVDGRRVHSPAWSPDGAAIAFVSGSSIFTRPSVGGTPLKVASASLPHSIAWSPDGAYLAFVDGNEGFVNATSIGNIAPSTVMIVSAKGGTPVPVTGSTALSTSPVWTSDSHQVLFVSNLHGSRDVYTVRIDGRGGPERPPVRLTTGLNVHTIALSQSGQRMAYSSLTVAANVWMVPIPDHPPSSIAGATQITAGSQNIEGSSVSHDRAWLFFDSDRAGNQDIYRSKLPHGEPEQLTTDSADDSVPVVAPDGSQIVFYSWRSGNRDLWLMGADGRSPQRLTTDPGHELLPDWSPDGQRIVYQSETGRVDVLSMVRRQGTGWSSPARLTTDGGGSPRWSPDGRYVAYVGSRLDTTRSVRVVAADGGKSRILVESPSVEGLSSPVWSRDSRSIDYLHRDKSGLSSIRSVPVEGGPSRVVVRFDDPARQPGARIDTDGFAFYITLRQVESDVWVIDIPSPGTGKESRSRPR